MEVNTLELWPKEARKIIYSKGLSISKLRGKYNNIIFPGDCCYDKQRQLFSTQIQERPLFIIKPVSADEIKDVLDMIYKYSLTIRIVGGRHSTALQNPDIFLDISGFNDIQLDVNLKVGAGATQGAVNAFLFNLSEDYHFPGSKPNHPNSLSFPGGSAASVGVAGISTIGGIGTLRRTLGLTVDSIKSFTIVIPPNMESKSKIVKVSEKTNSNLFWALLGGGGANFGVITEIIYYVRKINKVILYEVSWPWNKASAILELWQNTAPNRSNQYNEDLSLFTINSQNSPMIHLTGIYVIKYGETAITAYNKIYNELHSLKKLSGNLIIHEPTSYSNVYTQFVNERVYHSFSVGKTILTKDIIPIDILIDRIEVANKLNGFAYIGLQLMGGKISSIEPSATAFYPRNSKFFVDIFSFWDSPVYQEEHQHWNSITFSQLYPKIGPYCYLGFPITNLPEPLNAYYGHNKNRLLKIKNEIDPLGLLKFPDSL